MENKLIKFASKVSTPLSLASLVVLVLYFIFKAVLQLDVFSTLEEDNTFLLINSIVDKVFYLTLLALALGVLAYLYKLSGPPSMNVDAEYLKKELNISSIRQGLYAEKQLEVYRAVWEALDQLDEAGDELWNLVNRENLEKFSDQLDKTKRIARNNQILFEKNHFEQLIDIFGDFKTYLIGKNLVHTMRTKTGDELIESLQKQVEQNRRYKESYKKLKDKIGNAFRKQLAGE